MSTTTNTDASNMRTHRALRDCAEWLRYCLIIGWQKSQLNALEDLWWQYHDDSGALRP